MNMAVTVEMRTQVAELYVALFGRAPDAEGLGYWTQQLAGGASMAEVANAMYATDPARSFYPGWMTNQEIVASFYENALGRQADPEGLAYWTAKLDAPDASPGVVIQEIIDVVVNYTGSDPAGLESQALFNNKVAVAQWYGEHNGDIAGASAILAGVTSDPASVEAAKTGGGGEGQAFALTTGMDAISGTSHDDVFKANVVQNDLGQQVNTLGSGDELDGKGGDFDTLSAKITSGVFAGGNSSMPIQPETTGIEIIELEAVNSGISSKTTQVISLPLDEVIHDIQDLVIRGTEALGDQSLNLDSLNDLINDGFDFGEIDLLAKREVVTQEANSTEVYVNAKDMLGVTDIGSFRSDANQTIQNLTTQDDAGNARAVSDLTVHMEYTGNADSHWNESDLKVYFDQDYLTSQLTRTNPMVDFLAMNEDNYDATNGAKPLDGVFFRELKFTLNGERFDLKPYLNEDPEGTGSEITTYPEFLAAVQQALIELKADHPDNAALQTIEAEFGSNFTTDANPDTLELRVGTSVRLSVDGLTDGVENTLEVESTDLEVARAAGSLVPNNNRYELADANPPVVGEVLAINVALEKVGLAGDGGELVIGSMNKTADNHWDAVATTVDSTTSGIEEFDVTVYGDSTKSSSLAGLHSTNNNLRVVNVVTDAALTGTSFADLTIGNSNTDGLSGFENYENALKDVQTFDASGFKGDLTVFAALTDEVTAKYLDLQDGAAALPGADNVAFAYTGGTGNDNFNITLSAANLAAAGTTTREDMAVNVAGCDGDDMITLAIVDSEGNSRYDSVDEQGLALVKPLNGTGYANWYDNNKLNANLSIDGGAGNDTIWTPGSGDVIIDGGAGNDTVYADNTGDKAVWAFNVAQPGALSRYMLNNLQSDANNSYQLFETDVVVNFKGFEAKLAIATNKGVATDLDINQAIKNAINNDAVLSKLLVALDGPANTLVVSSLIDGGMADELSISLEGPAAADLSAGEVNQLITWYGSTFAGTTAAGFESYFAGQIAAFDAKADYASNFARDSVGFDGNEYTGDVSEHTSDNTITGDLGNDVLVLGTGEFSNDTVVYEGFGNGTDTIVNFTALDEFSSLPHNIADVTSVIDGTAPTAAVPAVAEVFTLNVTGTVGAMPGNITFDAGYFGAAVTVTPVAGESAATLAGDIVTAINTTAGTTWTAALGTTPGSVVFTQDVAAAVVDATVSNSLATPIAYDASGVGMTVEVDTQGVDAAAATPGTLESFTVAFGNADLAASYAFDGVTVPVLAGESGANIAAAFASASYTNWTATSTPDTSVVTFTANTVGDITDVTDASFVGANIEVVSYGLTPFSDTIDFSSYDAVAVHVDGALVDGFVSDALAGQNYVELAQSTTDAGAYTATVFTEAGATDTVVGLIGVLDFGVEQNFVADNFIMV
jgi:hypothetical protein